ncbi:astakine [Caerostris darwini]|uniref:Astakine n=1 Tax=Caerostris darwini TaxID=1538125 RepID=A0AAV4PV90_9ARAC|nr:astakine [Caerostris darwini]
MSTSIYAAFFVVLMFIGYEQVHSYSIGPKECTSQADCDYGECCVLGMLRYSTAQCMPMGREEDYCREDNLPMNRTLSYPNGEPMEVTEIYTHVCPCHNGFHCVDNFCEEEDSYEDNYLY